jgi:hypothetical protein
MGKVGSQRLEKKIHHRGHRAHRGREILFGRSAAPGEKGTGLKTRHYKKESTDRSVCATSGAASDDQGDVVVLFVGTELANFVDYSVEQGFGSEFAVAAENFE